MVRYQLLMLVGIMIWTTITMFATDVHSKKIKDADEVDDVNTAKHLARQVSAIAISPFFSSPTRRH